jgi:hypothetical protein
MFNHASTAVDTGNRLLSNGQVVRDRMISPRLDTEQHRALELLASSRFGISEEQLVHGHVCSRHVLAAPGLP